MTMQPQEAELGNGSPRRKSMPTANVIPERLLFQQERREIAEEFSPSAHIVFDHGDSLDTLRTCPDGFAKLIITSPEAYRTT